MSKSKESLANWRKAWAYFGLEGSKPYTYALHHKDESLKYRDPERYNEWRPEDLIVMNFNNHSKHHSGKKHSEETKKKISESLKGRKLSDEHREKIKQLMIGNQRAKKMK